MFDLQQHVPPYLMQSSRDFQLFIRLWQLWSSENRVQAKILENAVSPQFTPEPLLTYEAIRLGFNPSTQLSSESLRAILQVYVEAHRHKGSLQAVSVLVNSLVRASASADYVESVVYYDDIQRELVVQVSSSSLDVAALREALRWVLPVGVSLLFQSQVQQTRQGQVVEVDSSSTQYKTSVSNLSKIRATEPKVTADGWVVTGQRNEENANNEFANIHVGAVGIARVVGASQVKDEPSTDSSETPQEDVT